MRISEWIGVTYFAYLAAACARRRLAVAVEAVAAALVIAATARYASPYIRDVMPLAYILAGYYLCAGLFVRPSTRTEAWLLAWDHRLLGNPNARFSGWPRVVLAYLDVVYVGCFLLVPLGFALLALNGLSRLADRYWTVVMSCELGAFAPLAFVQTRPPWAIEGARAVSDREVHRAAAAFVQVFTIRVNTFPSGHAAGSIGVALALLGPMPLTGAVLLGVAITICIASVVGRYHYAVDVAAGVVLAAAVWLATPR